MSVVSPKVRRPVSSTALVGFVVALFVSVLVAVPTAQAAETGSVRFEVVDAITGAPLAATVLDVVLGNPGFVQETYSDLSSPISGLQAGQHTFFAVFDFYGNDDSGRIDGGNNVRGEMVTATVAPNAETVVRIEMTPPAQVRFRAVSEADGSIVSPLSVTVSPSRFGGSTGNGVVAEGNGWYRAKVYPAPFQPTISLAGSSSATHHTLPAVPSGTSYTHPENLLVASRPTVRGRVVDPNGNPVAGATVTVASSLVGFDLDFVATNSSGEFVIESPSATGLVAAFPPPGRSNLAAGSHAGRGLTGGHWPAGQRHPEIEIVLPYGRWYPANGARVAPTAARPATGYLPDGAVGAGVNVVNGAGENKAGWTKAGLMIEVFNHDGMAVIDLHRSLRPSPNSIATLAPMGGAAITCTLTVGCDVYRSQGPKGDQLVVDSTSTLSSFSLLHGAGAEALYLDPPLVSGREFGNISSTVAVSPVNGCSTGLTVVGGALAVASAAPTAPGSVTVSADGSWDRQFAVGLSAGGASAVVAIDTGTPVLPERAGVDSNAFGGLLPATCTPVTTTTTTVPATTTTTPTTTAPTTTTTTTTTATTVPTTTTTTTTTTVPTTTTTTTTTTGVTAPTSSTSTTVPVVDRSVGYAVVTRDGEVYVFGDTVDFGDTPMVDATAIVLEPGGGGYWVVQSNGVVHAFGDAEHLGNAEQSWLLAGEAITTMAASPDGSGYWLITDRGRVSPFGSARFFGDLSEFVLDGPVIDAAATPSGLGYYLVGSDGGLFSFGDARFKGSIPQVLPGVTLDAPVVGMTPDPDGTGYWFVAADGGVFGFDAPFRGSLPGVLPPGTSLVSPINGMVPYGNGYLLVAGDGGVFTFSNLPFLGSLGDVELTSPIVGISAA